MFKRYIIHAHVHVNGMFTFYNIKTGKWTCQNKVDGGTIAAQ